MDCWKQLPDTCFLTSSVWQARLVDVFVIVYMYSSICLMSTFLHKSLYVLWLCVIDQLATVDSWLCDQLHSVFLAHLFPF